ncbi:MAG: hypothetical protein SGJ02_13915 [bacterium]|nr:hypothetical protein [bacterium]
MSFLLLAIIAILEAAIVVFILWKLSAQKKNLAANVIEALQEQLSERKRLQSEMKGLMDGMVKIEALAYAVQQLREAQDQLKSEHGRIAITQTELETVETRLRELEEIERELEASNIEIQEELAALNARESDLRSKNNKLKSEIQDSLKHIEELLGEIEVSAKVLEHAKLMKTQLLSAEDKIEQLLLQIEETNVHYLGLKKRYDALDIEYAQLYEKFSDLDNAAQT